MTRRDPPTPGIALYVICLLIGAAIWKTSSGIVSFYRNVGSGDWAAATSPTSPVYHPLWRPLSLLELGLNVTLLVMALAALVLFWRRGRAFPVVACIILALNVIGQSLEVFYMADMVSTGRFPKGTGQPQLIVAIVELLLLGGYLLFSARVAALFDPASVPDLSVPRIEA